MKKRRLLAMVLILIFLAGAITFRPLRIRLMGLLQRESFFEGLPTSYWRGQAIDTIRVRFPSMKYRFSPSVPWLDSIRSFLATNSDIPRPDDRVLTGDSKALGVLLELLYDRESAVRQVACEGLAKIGPPATSAIPRLVELLGDPELDSWAIMDDKSETAAEEALAKIGSASVPLLLQKLQKDGPETEKIIATLGEIGRAAESAIPALKAKLKNYPSPAAWSLGQIGSRALPVLVEAMNSTDGAVCLAATRSLHLVGPRSVPHLLESAKSVKQEIRLAVSDTLWASGGEPKELLPAYVYFLNDEDAEVRRNAAYNLGEMKEAGIPGLIHALDSADPKVVDEARNGLTFTPGAVPALRRMLENEKNAGMRRLIRNALDCFGP